MAGKSFTCVETRHFLGVVPHAGVELQKVVVFPPPPHRFATHKQTTTPHHSNFHHGPTRRHQPSIHTGGPARGAQPRNNRRAGHGVSIRPFPNLSTFPRLANPADESRRDKLQDFLLEVQSFPRWSDGLACFSCTKVLPRDSFANPSGAQSGTTARMASRPNNSAHGLRTMMMSARRRFWCDGQCLNAGSGSGVNGSSGETQAKCYAD